MTDGMTTNPDIAVALPQSMAMREYYLPTAVECVMGQLDMMEDITELAHATGQQRSTVIVEYANKLVDAMLASGKEGKNA